MSLEPATRTYSMTFSGVRLLDGETFEPAQRVRGFFREAVPDSEEMNELVSVEFHDDEGRLHTVPAHAVAYLYDDRETP